MHDEKSKDSGQWKIRQSETLYCCPPYISLERQTIELPSGRVIDDYHALRMPESAVICALDSDHRVAMLRAYRHGIGGTTYLLPGGLIESTEAPIGAAKRELLEETGFISDCWECLRNFVPNSSYGCGRVHVFKCSSIRNIRKPKFDDLEVSHVEMIPVKELMNMIGLGMIQSLSTVAAIGVAITPR